MRYPLSIRRYTDNPTHRVYHEALSARLETEVWAIEESSLQAAVDRAIVERKHLRITGTHTLTEPLRLHGAYHATIDASRAVIRGQLDIQDCKDVTWQGGRFIADESFDNLIFVHGSALSNIWLEHMQLEGVYQTGVRVGDPLNTAQCDHVHLRNLVLRGQGSGQTGIHLGTSRWSNCLNHTIDTLNAAGHQNHLFIDATNVHARNLYFDNCETDIIAAANPLIIQGVRSEEAERFLTCPGNGSAPFTATISDVQWHGQDIAADGQWLRYTRAGYLALQNLQVVNPAVPAVVRCDTIAALTVRHFGIINSTIAGNGNVTVA